MTLAQYDDIQLADPAWLFDPLHHWLMTPGTLINKFDFPRDLKTGIRTARGGTVLMRRNGVPHFLKASANLQTTEPTTLIEPAAVGATVIVVEFANYRIGDVVTIGSVTPESKTVTNVHDNRITVTPSVSIARTIDTPVSLNAAVDVSNKLNGEVELLSQSYTDLDRNQEIVNLKTNRGTQIRINFLPDYSGGQLISATVEAKIRDLYNCFQGVA